MNKYNDNLLRLITIKFVIFFAFFSVTSVVMADTDEGIGVIPLPSIELDVLSETDGSTYDEAIEYAEDTSKLTDEEKADRAKYEEIEATVKSEIGSTAVSSGMLADTISTVAALLGVDVKVDYDKKSGLSCFSLDSSGSLNIVSCSEDGEVLSACDATAADDWKSATISCSGFELTASVVE
ncbi:hypothetical protein OAJ43_03990 [Nitrosomonadales bacterium]|nr:hypothetical protein [Nitrosomonadales bacterium]